MDLPQAHQLVQTGVKHDGSAIHSDPIGQPAIAAGYSAGEHWWEQMVEQRRQDREVFASINEAMAALREAAPKVEGSRKAMREALREAFMRQTICAAVREGFERIAVVCGVWHAPALDAEAKTTPSAKADAALLKGLPKVKVQAT